MTVYRSRKVNRVEIEQWTDLDDPPAGVHDVFAVGTLTSGYLSTHEGDRIVHLGDCIVQYPSGHIDVMSLDDVNQLFVKDE